MWMSMHESAKDIRGKRFCFRSLSGANISTWCKQMGEVVNERQFAGGIWFRLTPR